MIKLTQFKKTVSIGKIFTFLTFKNLMFDSGVSFPLNKENKLNLKRNQKSHREKVNLSRNNFQDFSLKKEKIITTYLRVLTTFIDSRQLKNLKRHLANACLDEKTVRPNLDFFLKN